MSLTILEGQHSMPRNKPLVSEARNYLVTTVAQAKTITTQRLRSVQTNFDGFVSPQE